MYYKVCLRENASCLYYKQDFYELGENENENEVITM